MGRGLRVPRAQSLAYARSKRVLRQAEPVGSSVGVVTLNQGLT